MALAHALRREDEYEGLRLPKGATVYANLWAVTRDARIYANPHAFDPARFAGPEPERDPWDIVFGYGPRYVCLSVPFAAA